MSEIMSDGARAVYDAIGDLSDELGHSPTLRELAERTDRSVATVSHHLDRLRAAGYVTWTSGSPRTTRTTRTAPPSAEDETT